MNKEKFYSKVEITATCWKWKGNIKTNGYARYGQNLASRIAYELFISPIPIGLFVLHKCDNPICVNPNHLFIGNQADNMKDMVIKKRHRAQKYGNPHGDKAFSRKLTSEIVLKMRELRKTGNYTFAALGKMFKVHPATVFFAVKGINWSSV